MQDKINFIETGNKLATKLKEFQNFQKSLNEISENEIFENPEVKLDLRISIPTHPENFNYDLTECNLQTMKQNSPESFKKLVKCLSDICEYEIHKLECSINSLFENCV